MAAGHHDAPLRNDAARERRRAVARVVLAAAYLLAGIAHLAITRAFLPVMPDWVPFPRETVQVTGLCEIAGAIGLMVPRTRWLAGLLLALYAVCVFPVNIKHAWLDLHVKGHGLGWWYHGPRLLAQPLIVWWALFAGGVVGRRRR